MIDLLLRQYGNIDYILAMPFRDGMAIFDKAKDNDRREYYYRQWLAYLPNMTKDNYVSFEDFYQERQQPQIDLRSKDEIMKEIYGEVF